MTESDAGEDEAEEEDDESFEQPDAADSTINATATTVATVDPRDGGAVNREAGVVKNFNEANFSNKFNFSDVMARSLESTAALPIGGGGQSRNRFPFAMAQSGPILTIA
jgi:hypothetical protein